MMAEHPRDDLQRLLDGLLAPGEAARVQAHLAGCERCRRELDAVTRVKTLLRRHPPLSVPAEVTARVRAAAGPARLHVIFRFRRLAVGAALAAAAVLAFLVIWLGNGRAGPVEAAASQFQAYRSGDLPLQLRTALPAELEQFFQDQGVSFYRVYDFGMMEYQLVGGSVLDLAGHRSTLFAYQGADEDQVICRMYLGSTDELPETADRRELDGITFHVFRRDGVTLVFWQEGAVVCVLAAMGDPERAVALARAKAVRVL